MNDPGTVRIVAVALAVLAAVFGLGGCALVWALIGATKDTQTVLAASIGVVFTLAGSCVGALASLLASTKGAP